MDDSDTGSTKTPSASMSLSSMPQAFSSPFRENFFPFLYKLTQKSLSAQATHSIKQKKAIRFYFQICFILQIFFYCMLVFDSDLWTQNSLGSDSHINASSIKDVPSFFYYFSRYFLSLVRVRSMTFGSFQPEKKIEEKTKADHKQQKKNQPKKNMVLCVF